MPRTVLTIGSFDGVHAGHASLARRVAGLARELAARPLALVFDPHPLGVLRPGAAPARLSTFDQRVGWLNDLGVERVVRLTPSPALLSLTPRDFVDRLAADHEPAAIVEGPDFRFGAGRAGDVRSLADLARSHGCAVHVLPKAEAVLSDHTTADASSTLVRWLLSQGRVTDAAAVLGRAYELVGVVEHGDRRGRGLGFPTANLATDQLVPADGVYAGEGLAPDGRSWPAAISIGTKPTFEQAGGRPNRAVEAYLIGPPPAHGGPAIDGLPEYGWTLRIRFGSWLRDQTAFPSAAALVDQLHRDVRRTAELAGSHPASAAAAGRP